MYLQTVIQKFWWFLITILIDSQVLSQELKLIGSTDLGISPKDAQKICQKIGGVLATLTDENRKFFTDKLFENCSTDSDFCPKMCVWEQDLGVNETLNIGAKKNFMMTQPVYPGDTLHLKLEMRENSMEVFQISDSLLEDLQVDAGTQKTQNVTLELVVYYKYSNKIAKNIVNRGITVGHGAIKKFNDHVENSIVISSPRKMKKSTNGTIELKLEFTKNQMLRISSSDLSGDQVSEYKVGKLDGRMYFKKFYDDVKVLDSYFTRGNCSKASFHHFSEKGTEGFVNCDWTRPTISIPVYSCRKASFVACSNVPPPSTTTSSSTTSTTHKKKKKSKINKNVTNDSETFDDPEDQANTEETYFHVEFLDEHIMFFVSLSGMSVALLVGSIVLQGMKMWQNRKLKIVKKKKKK